MSYLYAEVTKNLGPGTDRTNIVEAVDMLDVYGEETIDTYSSIYRFDQNFVDYVKKNNSVRDYKGVCRAIGLHFDFDSKNNDKSLFDCRHFVESVCSKDKNNVYIDNIHIFFSGNKGFHVIIKNEETETIEQTGKTPDVVKKLCMHLASHYSTFDPAVYDITRLFRVINSKHKKSGLYKIPLFASELYTMSLAEIKTMAKKQRRLSDKHTIQHFLNRGKNGIT